MAKQGTPIYDSLTREPPAIEEARALVKYRDLIVQLVRRDVVARYKRSVLGIAWTMLQPLGMMLILTVVFSALFHRMHGFPVYLLAGLIAWTFFSQTTVASMHHMVWGGALLHRIYVPRTAFVVSAIGTGLVNISLSMVPLFLVMLITSVPVKVSILAVPYAVLLLATFSLGLGLFLSRLAVEFPDVAEMYQVVLIGWMYLTPIIYPKELIPETIIVGSITISLRFWLFNLNPMYHLIEMFRLPLFEGTVPHWPTLLISTGMALVALISGWLIFTGSADELAYRT
jgi:homopolymeric O-antigen transport system permease protein